MVSEQSKETITTPTNSLDTHCEVPLITINTIAQTPLKLTSANYISWKLQFETLFIGYDLIGYIDGSTPCPPNTITTDNNTITNPSYKLWIQQDQLLLNAIINSLLPTIIPSIACACTAKEALNILANTYAKPSRCHIQQVKNRVKNPTKGTLNITEFLHSIKARADKLVILDAPVDPEDLTDKILDGLGDEYKELVQAIQARDTPISFDELHKKLISFEAHATIDTLATSFPITTNLMQKTTHAWRAPRFNNPRPSYSSPATTHQWHSPNFRPSYSSINNSPYH
uniref:Retrotransposon Copia-like N-terminal domain-containing protein n=1 Tax=Populus alba TaxID=43335 RepID=A0A4U5NAA6_POPAL|nr:hypothetical protein D5086_0000273310 [Populus alba]